MEVHLIVPGHVVDVGQDAVEDNLLGAEIREAAQDKIPALGNSEAV